VSSLIAAGDPFLCFAIQVSRLCPVIPGSGAAGGRRDAAAELWTLRHAVWSSTSFLLVQAKPHCSASQWQLAVEQHWILGHVPLRWQMCVAETTCTNKELSYGLSLCHNCDSTTTRLRRKIDMFIFCSRRVASNWSRRARYVVVVS